MPETKMPSKLSILERGLDYKLYCNLRSLDKPAVEVYKEWKKSSTRFDSLDLYQYLNELLVATMVSILVTSTVMKLTYIENHKIWITSPLGKTTIQLPLYQALRTIRKRGWKFTKVEPVKVPRTISKKEALRILASKNN